MTANVVIPEPTMPDWSEISRQWLDSDALFLDTVTTGLDERAEIMQLSVVMSNDYPSYDIKEPENIDERRIAATSCKAKLLEDMPVLVDNMDNKVDLAYVAWPTRVYFIDQDGKVKYDSGLGPYGLSTEELEKELSNYLSTR